MPAAIIRKAFVANQFYPGDREVLRAAVEAYLKAGKNSEKAAGNPPSILAEETAAAIISPHAGYIYSGCIAGRVYAGVTIPDDIILIGPNHTGLGERAAVFAGGEWEVPLGRLRVNEKLSRLVLDKSPSFTADTEAHAEEHSLEVQLPFIYVKNPGASIVPITVMPAKHSECEEMGYALAAAIKEYGKDVLIIVSSDMNHYEPESVTIKKDKIAIDKVLLLDSAGLLDAARKNRITMCGVVPAAIAIAAAKKLGATAGTLIAHSTSGKTSGDYEHVVGYAGIIIK